MIKEILEQIENIKPKSLFSKIEVIGNKIKLTINSLFDELKIKTIGLNYIENTNYLCIFTDGERYGTLVFEKLDAIIPSICSTLDCKLINLDLELLTYDVWGNENDGFEINDQFSSIVNHEMLIHVPTLTPIITTKEISNIIDWKHSMIDYEWSDPLLFLNNDKSISWGYFINQESNQKPIGEIRIADTKKNMDILNSLC